MGTSRQNAPPPRPPSGKGKGTGCLRLFFLPFFLIGTGFFATLLLRPLYHVWQARHWQVTPCVIDSSEVGTHPGDEDTTFSVDIAYHYTFGGQPYTSRRYDFVTITSLERRRKEAIVKNLSPGTETVCYVDPTAPAEAVINRGWRPDMGAGFLGLFFGLLGGLGVIFAGYLGRRGSPIESEPQPLPADGRPLVLRPRYTPAGRLAGITVGAFIWNGFIGLVAYFLFFLTNREGMALGVKIFLGLFALVGLALIWSVFSNILALLFNPRLRVTVQKPYLRAGDELSFSWTILGRASRLHDLRITLEARRAERSDSDAEAVIRVVKEIAVFETTNPELIAQGAARVVIPTRPPPDCEDEPGSVAWQLHVRGKITGMLNLNDEFPITLQPRLLPA